MGISPVNFTVHLSTRALDALFTRAWFACPFIDRLKILAQGLLLHQAVEREQSEFDPVLPCLD